MAFAHFAQMYSLEEQFVTQRVLHDLTSVTPREKFIPLLSITSHPPFLPQQTLPVDLSNSGVRGAGNNGASFHGSTSAFDPCCPGSTSRPPAFVSQATPGPSQPAVVESFSSSMVAQPQPQTQPQPCRHYMHPSCE